jgi:hypothetical protein
MEKEFKDIGKKMPYSVPDGFFETITAVTLEKARRKERADRKRIILLRWLAAAAVLTGVVFASIRLLTPPEEHYSPLATGNHLEIQVPDGLKKPDSLVPFRKTLPVGQENTISVICAESMKSVDSEESMDELLASIPDEELLEWATLMRNDPFSEETENNAYHEDN